jgi:hypothetical protein
MATRTRPAGRGNFMQFYHSAYRDDHSTWPNRAFHITGTIAGLTLLAASFTVIPVWWALAFPVVHAVPGLIGHRLFERNPEMGDMRVFHGNYPGLWYMAANHMMTAQTLRDIITFKKVRQPR